MDNETWYVIEISPRGSDDWVAYGSNTYDSLASAKRSLPPGNCDWQFRVMRKTLVTEFAYEGTWGA